MSDSWSMLLGCQCCQLVVALMWVSKIERSGLALARLLNKCLG